VAVGLSISKLAQLPTSEKPHGANLSQMEFLESMGVVAQFGPHQLNVLVRRFCHKINTDEVFRHTQVRAVVFEGVGDIAPHTKLTEMFRQESNLFALRGKPRREADLRDRSCRKASPWQLDGIEPIAARLLQSAKRPPRRLEKQRNPSASLGPLPVVPK
jgi:hypothetical protein